MKKNLYRSLYFGKDDYPDQDYWIDGDPRDDDWIDRNNAPIRKKRNKHTKNKHNI